MSLTRETCTIIAMLAPTVTFREIQQAHRVFRLNAASQYMVRTWSRHLDARHRWYGQTYEHFLPSGLRDGITTIIYVSGNYLHKFYSNGTPTRICVHYSKTGVLLTRQKYFAIGAKRYVSTFEYDAHGKEISCDQSCIYDPANKHVSDAKK